MKQAAAFVFGFIGYVCINVNSWEEKSDRSIRMAMTGQRWFSALEE